MHVRKIAPLSSAVLFLALMLTGCNQATLIEKFTPEDAKASAENDINLLRQNNLDQLQKKLDPSIEDPHDDLARMAVMFPARQAPTSIKVVGFHVSRTAEATTREISLEYEFPEKYLLANIVTETKGNISTITTFHVNELNEPLEYTNRFTMAGKGLEHYLMLVMILLHLAFTIYALILCLHSNLRGKSWYWPILIFLGAGTFNLNWNTGEVDFSAFTFHIPAVGASGGIYTPWIVYASIPVGAILFLLFREDLTEHAPKAVVPPATVVTH